MLLCNGFIYMPADGSPQGHLYASCGSIFFLLHVKLNMSPCLTDIFVMRLVNFLSYPEHWHSLSPLTG